MGKKWRDPNLIVYWTCLTALLLVVLLAPRGCSQSEIKGSVDLDGRVNIRSRFNSSLAEELKAEFEAELAKQSFERQDYFFLVINSVNTTIDLTYMEDLSHTPILMTVSLPGTVISSNANRIEGHTAVWSLSPGKDHRFKIVTRQFRWWLIGLSLVCLSLAVYARVALKKQAAPAA